LTTHADGTPAATFPAGYAPARAPAAPNPPPEPPVAQRPVRSAAARRRTSRRALIISVLVVLVGALLAFAAGQMLTKHTEVLAVAHDVPVGATIQDSDLTVASVTKDPNLSPIPASQRPQIVGMVAQVGLAKGELLTRAQVGPKTGFTAGQQLVALPLKQGQFPARGVAPGQKVLIVATPGTAGSAGSSSSSAPPSTPGISGTVAEVGSMNQATQITVVDVQVSADSGVEVAQLASTGNLALILLPAGR
jgi:SAF domain